MNGPSRGVIKEINRPLGIGAITPNSGSDTGPVLFTPAAVRGGQRRFEELAPGQPVKYRKYPNRIGDADFTEDVEPDDR